MELSTASSIASFRKSQQGFLVFFCPYGVKLKKKGLLPDRGGQLAEFENLPLFGGRQVLDLLGFRVRNLFHLVQRPFLFILADLLFFLQLVNRFLDVAPDVAHRSAVILQHFVQVLHDILPALFRRRRHWHSHHLAVVGGVQPQVRSPYGFVDQRHHARVPWRNHQQSRLRHRHRAELIYRHGRPVIIHAYCVQNRSIGAPRAQGSQFLAKILDRLFHPRPARGNRFFRRHRDLIETIFSSVIRTPVFSAQFSVKRKSNGGIVLGHDSAFFFQ